MSFADGFKRILQGKPAFEAPATPESQDQPVTCNVTVKVSVEQTDSRFDGDKLDTYCDVQNNSNVDVLLDKIRVAGVRRELDTTLKAGDSKQVHVYSGPAFHNDSANDAELQYKIADGTYYIARHDVRFEQHDDVYIIEDLKYENTSKL